MSLNPYYTDAFVSLYHGRAEDILPGLLASGKVRRPNHVITDPPYDEHTHASVRSSYRDGKAIWDSKEGKSEIDLGFAAMSVEDIMRVIMPVAAGWVVSFCSLEMLGEYQRLGAQNFVRSGFWHRINSSPQMSGDRPAQPGEGIAILRGSSVGRMRWNRGGHQAFWETCIVPTKSRTHKTQKPESLMTDIVAAFTRPRETICDPFCGSGTTLVSAKRLGRYGIGIDVDAVQLKEAARRLAQQPLPLVESPRRRRRQNKLDFASAAV